MTRATNFGRKRTYVQAGFPEHETSHWHGPTVDTPQPESSTTAPKTNNLIENEPTQDAAAAPPPKKKRKRTPKSKRDGYAAQRAAEAGITLEEKSNDGDSAVGWTNTGGDSEKSTLTRVEKKQKRNLARRMKGPSSSRFFRDKRG